MALIQENLLFILPIIAVLAVLVLASTKPSTSAIFLFFQSILINLYLALSFGLSSLAFGGSLLLTFIAMIVIGCNYYFELSFSRKLVNIPKFNITLGALLIFVFWQQVSNLISPVLETKAIEPIPLNHDNLFTLISGFSLFAILVCALFIFDMKNPQNR